MSASLPLPQSPSGFIGTLFGKLMEWLNTNAYRKAIHTLEPARDERILEIGFGTGRFAEMLLEMSPAIFVAGVDPTLTMVQTAKDRLAKHGFADRVDLRQGMDEVLPWDDNSFHAVVAIHSFQFWKDPEHSIKEINRVLQPNGRFIIVFRDHAANPPAWLPNPISRSGKEIELTKQLLEENGYACVERMAAGSSRIIRAERRI